MDDSKKQSCSLCGKYKSIKGSNLCTGCLRIDSFVRRNLPIVKKIIADLEKASPPNQPTPSTKPAIKPKVVTEMAKKLVLSSKLAKQNLEQAIADLERNIESQESRLKENRIELKKLKEQLSNF